MIKIARGKSGQTEAKMKSWNVIDDRKKEVKPTQRKKTRERKDERYLEREREMKPERPEKITKCL